MNKIIQGLIGIVILMIPSIVSAQQEVLLAPLLGEIFDGYSYMFFGLEQPTYEENTDLPQAGKTLEITSHAQGDKNLVYSSGAILKIDDIFDFSYDIGSTIFADTLEETWKIDGKEAQKNQAEVTSNSMIFLLHYKLKPHGMFGMVRAVGGISYYSNNFKRFGWDADEGIGTDSNIVDERVSSLVTTVGTWLETKTVGLQGFRQNYVFLVGLPLWQSARNTLYPGLEFTNAAGYNLELWGRWGYTVKPGVELGPFLTYTQVTREGESQKMSKVFSNGKTYTAPAGSKIEIIWPDNVTTFTRFGLLFTWKFRDK
ncbi:hypothetical protein WDW89_16000 [Deltaproteobacteria bacterium TL4]